MLGKCLILVAACGLIGVGCGSDDSEDPAETVPTSEAASVTTSAPAAETPTTAAGETASTVAAVTYANCDEVKAAGAAPIHSGDPGYSTDLDRDGDGVACEN